MSVQTFNSPYSSCNITATDSTTARHCCEGVAGGKLDHEGPKNWCSGGSVLALSFCLNEMNITQANTTWAPSFDPKTYADQCHGPAPTANATQTIDIGASTCSLVNDTASSPVGAGGYSHHVGRVSTCCNIAGGKQQNESTCTGATAEYFTWCLLSGAIKDTTPKISCTGANGSSSADNKSGTTTTTGDNSGASGSGKDNAASRPTATTLGVVVYALLALKMLM